LLTASSRSGAPRPPAFQVPATVAPAAPSSENQDVRRVLHKAFCEAGMNTTADALHSSDVRLQGSELVIKTSRAMTLALREPAVQRIASEAIGKPVRVRIQIGDDIAAGQNASSENTAVDESEIRQRALSDPGVKRFQELFPGAQVRTVRNLNE